jgi:hypothetical protein
LIAVRRRSILQMLAKGKTFVMDSDFLQAVVRALSEIESKKEQ